jgi:hypothetical protein
LCTGVRNGNKIWELPNDETLHVVHVVAAGHILSMVALRFQLAVESCHERSTRYLLLNIELSNGALENGIHQQDTFTGSTSQCAEYITHLKEDDLRVQPLRSVRVTQAMNPPLGVTPCYTRDSFISFTIYEITVLGGPYEWKVYRRFSEFRKLHLDLQLHGFDTSNLPELPSRTLCYSTLDSVIQHRQEILGTYLQSGIFIDSVLCQAPAVLDFMTKSAQDIRLGVVKR